MSPRPTLAFVNQHYWPDVASTGQHLTDLAEYLAAEGFDVTVVCSRGRYRGGALRAPRREVRRGVRIVRLPATGFGRAREMGRLADYLSFMLAVLAWMGTRRRFDLAVFLTTPSLIGTVGAALRMLRGQRFVVWSMDLHPEIEEALGILPPGPARAFRAVAAAADRRAEFVVALGECMRRRLVERGHRESALRTIPVWSRGEDATASPRSVDRLARTLGLEGQYVVMYSGNAGRAHRFDEVLEAMDRLGGDPGYRFLFVGGGPRKAEILDRAGGLPNFRYLDYRPRSWLAAWLSLADVHLVTMRGDVEGLVVPGKLYGIMAAGRPAVLIGPRGSSTARTIESEGIGVVIDPADGPGATDRLVVTLEGLRRDPEERERMGRRARQVFLEKYERAIACAEWTRLLRGALGVDGTRAKE
ncbi:MAG TPA: glycosyltransferase family 4 protein [Gemmatimonadota bacterium]|nr:glycosyltransferase family 4 protein [Gemmatimonadota bacterium]